MFIIWGDDEGNIRILNYYCLVLGFYFGFFISYRLFNLEVGRYFIIIFNNEGG